MQKRFTLTKASLAILALMLGLGIVASAQRPQTVTVGSNEKMQQLSAGIHSTIGESFVLVARDLKTYNLLRGTVKSLPDQSAAFFDSHAVVAIFLGTRPTAGYDIDVSIEGKGKIRIKEIKPREGAILKMVLSSPHKIVAILAEPSTQLSFVLDETWQSRLRSYRITSGEGMSSKGKERRAFKLNGTIQVIRTGDLVTFLLEPAPKSLFDVVSGKLDSSNYLTLNRFYAFDWGGPSPCKGDGEFANSEQELTLRVESTAVVSGSARTVASLKASASQSKN